MRTVLIVDDEPLIVTGLSEKVDWQRIGCRVVATACNGSDAIDLLDRLDPDILLTDIVMPGKSGLELAAYLIARGRRTRVVLLSTYDHFDYAREGIRMGVVDYILKPIDITKLMEAVQKAAGALDEMESRAAPQIGGTETTRKEALFEIIQHGMAYVGEETLARCRFERAILFCARVFNAPVTESVTRKTALKRTLTDALAECGIKAYARTIGEVIAVAALVGDMQKETPAASAVDGVCRDLSEGGVTCVAVRSGCVEHVQSLHQAYQDCLTGLRQAYFAPAGGLFEGWKNSGTATIQQELDDIRSALEHGNNRQLEKAFMTMGEKLRAERDAEQAAHALREVVRMSTVQASAIGMVEKPQMRADRAEENFESRYQTVLEYATKICTFIEKSQSLSGRMQLLMRDNYTRSDFSLGDLADKMGMSVPYLSRLFKKEMGENFQDVLVNMRIDRAKELLMGSGLKNNEIARRVGFEDERYFGQVFRKHCGMTPKQFRETRRE